MEVSVVIAARDAAGTIDAALASLHAQTHTAWEAVVVENRSTDETAEIVAAAAADERIRLIRSQAAGVSAARNEGIAAAAHDWLLFLDADDELAPDALAALSTAAEGADAACSGWIRRSARGDERREHPPRWQSDLFAPLARRCVFPIHCCLVRKARVEAVGGFDGSLTTCEDWDLWQRIARTGARFAMVEGHHAIYRLRPGSATADAPRLLADGLAVIARGHDPDPRVAEPHPDHAAGRPDAERYAAELMFGMYVAGVALVTDDDGGALLASLPDRGAVLLDPLETAHQLFAGVLSQADEGVAAWARLHARADELLAALERRSRTPQLARRTRAQLDRLIAEQTGGAAVGAWQAIDVDLEQPLHDFVPVAGAERLRVRAVARGRTLGDVEMAICGEIVPAGVVADAVAAAHAWTIAAAFLGPPELDWDRFLRELLGRPDLAPEAAYDRATDWGPAAPAPRDVHGRAVAELTTLPVAPPDDGPVVLTCAGVPLGVLAAAARDPSELVVDALTAGGYEICRAAVRDGLIGRPWDASLRELLRRGPAVAAESPSFAPLLGRRAPTMFGVSHNRRAVFPKAAVDALLDMAAAVGEPVVGTGVAYVPELIGTTVTEGNPRRREPAPVRQSVRHHFEAQFAGGPDPWGYESEYEQRKYEQTLELIGDEPILDALELGCAEGHFTARLRPRVGRLTAADISAIALERAQARCARADVDDVRFVRLDITTDDLPGPVDLVVCSELLYNAGDDQALGRVADKLRDCLRPGGILVHAHAHVLADDPSRAGFDWGVPFGADLISEVLADAASLHLEEEIDTGYYRVQRFRRRRRRPRFGRRPVRRREPAVPPLRHVARHFHPHGGVPGPAADMSRTGRVPILMYHRVSARSGPRERWRVTPEQFAEQIGYLYDAGYCTIELEEWLDHSLRQSPIPGRPVVISFDDGDADFPNHAWPVLEAHGFGVNVFLPTDHVGGTTAWETAFAADVPLLSWAEARQLETRGVRFGSHTASHAALIGAPVADVAVEFARSRARLHRELEHPLEAVAYPFGDVDGAIEHLAGACGYVFGVTCRPGRAELTDSPLDLPRIEVTGDDTLESFIAKLG